MCVKQGFRQYFEFCGGGGGRWGLQSLVLTWRGSGGMLPQIFFIIGFIDDLRLILGVLRSKREVHTARLSFI